MAFVGRAREQAERILSFAAGGGVAVLAELSSARVEASTGFFDEDSRFSAVQRLCDSTDELIAIDEKTIVGRVGESYALVVWLVPGVPISAVSSERVMKACDLLARMVSRAGGPPTNPFGSESGGGAPAEVSDWIGPDWKNRS